MLSSVACCLPAGVDSKALLAENWVAKAADAAAAAAGDRAPPAFDPRDPQYNELARRLSKCAATRAAQRLAHAAAALEKQLPAQAGDAKEAKRAELEELQQQLADARAALADVQASFEQDALALVPWMSALFALADSGCTLDAGGGADGWPPPCGAPSAGPPGGLMDLLTPPLSSAASGGGAAGLSAWLFRGAEKVLGAFARRYELERGPGLLTLATRLALAPGCGGDAGALPPAELAAAVEGGLEASRMALLGPEGVAAGRLLDCVNLVVPDGARAGSLGALSSFVSVLLAVNRWVAPPGWQQQQQQQAADGGPAPKVAALGLVNPTEEAITAAVRAGVRLSCVVVPLSILDASAAPVARLAASHGLRVVASCSLAHGLISEALLGLPQPDTAAAAGAAAGLDCRDVSAGLDMVERFGGWPRFQALLARLKDIADAAGTSVPLVALAWVAAQGALPLIPARWPAAAPPPGDSGSRSAPCCVAGCGSAVSSAPWAATLGLLHHHSTEPPPPPPPPPPAAKRGARLSGAVAPAATPVGGQPDGPGGQAEGLVGGGAPLAAAAEGGGGGGSAPGEAQPAATGSDAPLAPAVPPRAAEPQAGSPAVPAAVPEGAPSPHHEAWSSFLSGLLGEAELRALAEVVGPPAASWRATAASATAT